MSERDPKNRSKEWFGATGKDGFNLANISGTYCLMDLARGSRSDGRQKKNRHHQNRIARRR